MIVSMNTIAKLPRWLSGGVPNRPGLGTAA